MVYVSPTLCSCSPCSDILLTQYRYHVSIQASSVCNSFSTGDHVQGPRGEVQIKGAGRYETCHIRLIGILNAGSGCSKRQSCKEAEPIYSCQWWKARKTEDRPYTPPCWPTRVCTTRLGDRRHRREMVIASWRDASTPSSPR